MAITESDMNAIKEMFMEASAELLAKERVILEEMFKGERAATNERFNEVDERFNKVDERFDKIDERFDRIDERLERLEEDISIIQNDVAEINVEVAKLNLTAKTEAVKRAKRG